MARMRGVLERPDGLAYRPDLLDRDEEAAVRETLQQGPYGWEVTDCRVLMTHSGFVPVSTAGDFRSLAPLVVMNALQQAGTTVYEPIHRFHLEIPAETLGPTLHVLARLHGVAQKPAIRGSSCMLEGDVPAAHVHELRQRLPALTRGEGVLESAFDRYRPVRGTIPTRPRSDHNPLNRDEYLLRLAGRVKERGAARVRS